MDISKASFKKTLGAIGCITIYFIGVYAVIKDVTLTLAVLTVLSALVFALFGLKKWDGKIGGQNGNQGTTE